MLAIILAALRPAGFIDPSKAKAEVPQNAIAGIMTDIRILFIITP
jgi:hypothetical protein